MSASRLTASMLRMAPTMRSSPAVRVSQRALPCTCQAATATVLARRLQSTTTASNSSTAASTSTDGLSQDRPAATRSAPLSESARIAQESFRRQQSRARPLPVIKVSSRWLAGLPHALSVCMKLIITQYKQDQKKLYLGVAVFAITAWSFFVLWAMSAEKAASSGVYLPDSIHDRPH